MSLCAEKFQTLRFFHLVILGSVGFLSEKILDRSWKSSHGRTCSKGLAFDVDAAL
jgi:hypothetical protein